MDCADVRKWIVSGLESGWTVQEEGRLRRVMSGTADGLRDRRQRRRGLRNDKLAFRLPFANDATHLSTTLVDDWPLLHVSSQTPMVAYPTLLVSQFSSCFTTKMSKQDKPTLRSNMLENEAK